MRTAAYTPAHTHTQRLHGMLNIGRQTAQWRRRPPRHRGALRAIGLGLTASRAARGHLHHAGSHRVRAAQGARRVTSPLVHDAGCVGFPAGRAHANTRATYTADGLGRRSTQIPAQHAATRPAGAPLNSARPSLRALFACKYTRNTQPRAQTRTHRV